MDQQRSLGDQAVLIAGALAIVLVGLFGAEPEEVANEPAQTVQVAKR
ncbi:MAG TPA: hypothetical protein VKC64_02800 [Burkholderiales bacterium]|nr:hypothetical protein [Burkholderiales bacterium]